MAEPVLPPLPDRDPEPADNPVAAEPAVPPAEAAEPGEENEVMVSLFPYVLHPVFRFSCQRSRRLGCIFLRSNYVIFRPRQKNVMPTLTHLWNVKVMLNI